MKSLGFLPLPLIGVSISFTIGNANPIFVLNPPLCQSLIPAPAEVANLFQPGGMGAEEAEKFGI